MSEAPAVTVEALSVKPGVKQSREGEKRSEAEKPPKQRLLEALRPDEKTKGEINTIVTEAAVEMMEGKSDEERHLIETGTKIFLWQFLVNDTGSQLPEGLAIHGGWKGNEPKLSEIVIGFDQAIITKNQYLKIVKTFQEKEVLQKVVELQQQYREQNRRELVEAMKEFIVASPLTDYFASFSVGENHSSPRDLNVEETAALTATLEGEFARRYGVSSQDTDIQEAVKFGSHALQKSYHRQVSGPVLMATTDKAPDHTNHAQDAPALDRFRQHVLQNCFGKNGTPAERISVEDGHFMVAFFKPAPEMLPMRDGPWPRLALEEIEKIDNTIFRENKFFPARALQLIGPRLYGSTDGYQDVIDQGISDAADMLVKELITDNFFDRGIEYIKASSNHPNIIAWLSGGTSPIVQQEGIGRGVESIGRIEKYELETTLALKRREYLRIKSVSELEFKRNFHRGEVQWADPEIFSNTFSRLLTRELHDPDLPTVITPELEDAAHLRVQSSDPTLTSETLDMGIAGMKLIAREGDEHLFVLDRDNPKYGRIEDPIPENVRDRLVDECRSIWMDGLADEIESATELTTSKMVDLAVNYAVYWAPTEGQETIEVESLSDFAEKGLVDDEGKLHGQCEHFELFVRKLCNIIYGYNARRVHKLGGKSLTSSRYIDDQGHAQTGLNVPEKGIDAIIDIEPFLQKIDANWDYIPSPKKVRPRTLPHDSDFTSGRSEQRNVSDDSLDQAMVMAQEKAQADAALAIFAMDLTSYLGVKNSFEHTEWGFNQWNQETADKLGPDLQKGAENWGNKPHILLYTMLRQYKEGSVIPSDDITRVRSILYKYKEHAAGGERRLSRADYISKMKDQLGEQYDSLYRFVEPTQPPSWDELMQQGIVPDYHPNFLQHMDHMVETIVSIQKS
jgi:hypothetical protein